MRLHTALLVAICTVAWLACGRNEQSARGVGARFSDGYVLFSPLLSTTTYLIDRDGRVVHTWESELAPGASVYLLENGRLLRSGRHPGAPRFRGGGLGGRLQEFDWDGRVTWDWSVATSDRLQHHDVCPLPTGNVLVLAWEAKTREEALRAGRAPTRVGPDGLWPESILEVRPLRPRGAEVVWEWHMWDHLLQDRDARCDNYGRIGEHPERIDVNGDRPVQSFTAAIIDRLRSIGYIGSGVTAADLEPDFVHANAIAYHPRLDEIALTVNRYGEVWIIDHATTTAEAAGHQDGRRGRGGDLLYRWGNPAAYDRGTTRDRHLYAPHDGRWIPDGYPGAGHLLVFNNGLGAPEGSSSVLEFDPSLGGEAHGAVTSVPSMVSAAVVWMYPPPGGRPFHADFISGAHRLANGNTFITNGPEGRFFEVTPRGDTVWSYRNPYSGSAPNPAGDPAYSVFRATLLPADYRGLAGRGLTPRRQP